MNIKYDLFVNARVDMFPYVSSLIIKKADASYVTLSLVPNDAACAAATITHISNEFGGSIELKCVNYFNVINYPEDALNLPEINTRDDYFIFIEGLETYFLSTFK